MDEFTAVLKARELVGAVNPTTIPVPLEAYLEHINAVLRLRDDLGGDEAGMSFESSGKRFICINAKDSSRRRRFTICHEIAHFVLELPSDHTNSWWSYAKRSPSEIFCDAFAAELLLPYRLFKPIVEKASISLATIDDLANQFDASATATGSRFATVVSAPCAFVLSEQGKIRYSARSKALREVNAWIPPRAALPSGSLSERARAGGTCEGPEKAEADNWFSDWDRGGTLLEDAIHLAPWDQTLTLLWFEDEEIPAPKPYGGHAAEEETGLPELDGILPWPGKNRRK